jgi:uncharacterized protein
MAYVGLVAFAVLVGGLIGGVGVGGVLLGPVLVAVGVDAHAATGTCAWAFVFTGVAGTWRYGRRGAVPWGLARRLGVGALPGAVVGVWANRVLPVTAVVLVVAALAVAAGVYALWPHRAGSPGAATEAPAGWPGAAAAEAAGAPGVAAAEAAAEEAAGSPGVAAAAEAAAAEATGSPGLAEAAATEASPGAAAVRRPGMGRVPGGWAAVGVGVAVGFGSALTGTGGPVLLVPALLALRAAPLVAVGAGQVVQLPVAAAAATGYLVAGSVRVGLGTVLGVAAAAGVLAGAAVARRADAARLRAVVGLACVAAGALLLVRTIAAG